MKVTEEEFKTKCLSCEAKYLKEKWLFDFCPNCKSKNLIDINKTSEVSK